MTDAPDDPAPAGPVLSPFILLGVPVLTEVIAVYLLVAVETPFSPQIQELLGRPGGIVLLALFGMMAVLVVMFIVLSWAQWRHRRRTRRSEEMGP